MHDLDPMPSPMTPLFAASSASLDRSRVPSPGPRPEVRFPEVHSFHLDNGLRILFVPRRELPIFTGQLLIPAGGQWNPLDRPGLADLHGALLDQGTEEENAEELARHIETLGGSLTSGAGWNMAYVETSILSEHLDEGLRLVADSTLRPTFPEDKVSLLASHNRASLLRRRSSPRELAEDFFSHVAYRGTPYAFPDLGSPQSLEAIDRQQILDFYSRHATPRGSVFVGVGDCDPEHLHAQLERLLGSWQPEPEPVDPEIVPELPASRQVHIVDRPGAAQTQLHLGQAGPPRTHEDFNTLLLLNMALGGKFTSRLNLNLREKHGFTYGVSSRFGRRRGPGPFFIRTAVATDSAGHALRETLFELERILDEPIPRDELQESIDYFLGVFPYTMQTITDISNRLEQLAIFRLPDDYYQTYPAALADLTPQDLLDAGRRHLFPDRLFVVAAGPAEELEPQLQDFGEVHVHRP